MGSYLRPRRGTKDVATSALKDNAKLKSGEVFFEVPDAGVGKGQGRLMMGDGTSDYSSLNAFLAFDMSNVQTFSNVNTYDHNNKPSAIINSINPASTLAHNLNRIKSALLTMNSQLSNTYDDTYFSFIKFADFTLPNNTYRFGVPSVFGGGIYDKPDSYSADYIAISAIITNAPTDLTASIDYNNGHVRLIICNNTSGTQLSGEVNVRIFYVYYERLQDREL